ncbi:MAG: RagB/SusD family nutrient uptake outer membrane protein [Bacteroidales bacterium]|nr:RagB/SusD family nutrient uptake outer membrane protein [Bacteroidales bacterium]
MKKNKKYSLYLLCGALALCTSCEDFLDRQEDEAMTFEKIWTQRSTTYQYFLNAMSFLPDDANDFNYSPWMAASDEGTVTYNRDFRWINFGSWNASSVPYYQMGNYYNGIRECNIFMQNVDRCNDPLITAEEKAEWKIQSRWARAYYYFMMMRVYGPVFLLGDELLDFTQTTQQLERPRNTWEECVDYVVSEMEECAKEMTPTWASESKRGLATQGACYAVISRLKLYSARPLFNGNTLYKDVKNPDGTNLFPVSFEAKKWKEAADAAKRVIDMGVYSLYRDAENPDDPYKNWDGLVHNSDKYWNEELIWTTGYAGLYTMGVHTAPTGISGTAYGGVGPTQQQVDAYAMNDGRYPITGYQKDGTPIIDEESGYTEEGKSMFLNPFFKNNGSWTNYAPAASGYTWPNMYKDREPRFYMTVFWSDSYWQHGTETGNFTLVSFAKGGNSNKSHDYPKSGYIMHRFYNHQLNSTTGTWGNIVFPTFRLGEIYLNFIEAALECSKNGVSNAYLTEAMTLWEDLRDRVGLPAITDVYPGATTEELIELCRKERRVELAFENHRYFDTRTWMIAEETDNGPMYGMNVDAPILNNDNKMTPENFWQRTVFETRVFKNNHYLYPFSQRELDRNKKLTQNYGW